MSGPTHTQNLTLSEQDIAVMLDKAQNLMRSNKFADAADLAQTVIGHRQQNGTAWFLLCQALVQMQSVDAEKAMRQARDTLPDTDLARQFISVELCRALGLRAETAEVVDLATELGNLKSLTPLQHHNLSTALSTAAQFDKALFHANEAVKARPDFPEARHNRGMILRNLGKIVEAESDLEYTINHVPHNGLAHASLADLKKWSPETNHIERLNKAISDTGISDEDRARLYYALFKECNDVGDYENAWTALDSSTRINARLYPDNPERRTEWTNEMVRQFTGNLSESRASDKNQSTPIFIVGLPRSGTTLVERILAAHPNVTPMGETQNLEQALLSSLEISKSENLDIEVIKKIGKADWSIVRSLFLRKSRYFSGRTKYFTEKLPHNYTLVGVARKAFPESPIIHVRRDSMDSLFGAFRVLFSQNAYTWSYSFDGLRNNYKEYRKLTDHWARELGATFVQVNLEDIISDTDSTIERMMDQAGIDFVEACLQPHKVEGGVATASSAQIRKPINSDGIGAWRNYRDQLEPLRRMLQEDGFVDGEGNAIWK